MSILSFPNSSILLVCQEPKYYAPLLPEGYSFSFYRPGMEADWCQLLCSIGAFPDTQSALNAFAADFGGTASPLLRRRMLFVLDEAQRSVATACLWNHSGTTFICGMATLPKVQGNGIGRALAAKLIEIYQAEELTGGIYLLSLPEDLHRLWIFRQLGFTLHTGSCPPRLSSSVSYSAQESLSIWEALQSKLDGYTVTPAEIKAGSNVEKSMLSPHTVFFTHSTMFSKCNLCKVFEVSAPAQSGDVPHAHDYSQIWYVTCGSCEHTVEGSVHKMRAGDAFLLPPKVLHSTVLHDNSSIICCEFYMDGLFSSGDSSYDKIRSMTQNISFAMLFQQEFNKAHPRFSFSHEGQRTVEKLMHTLLQEYTEGADFFEDCLHLLILQLLLTFAREYRRLPTHDSSEKIYDKYHSMVENAIRYINEHFDEPLTLDSVCKISMVSKTYFCYLFKVLTDQTFVEYLTDRRIDKSMELLRQTDLSVITISQMVGFRDSTNFSRIFKRLKGISPREYRRSVLDT